MAKKKKKYTVKKAHRLFARQLNGRTWELLDKGEARGAAGDEEMLHAAHASLYHWLQVGTGLHHQRGAWLISRVHVALGNAPEAMRYARHCLALTDTHKALMQDFDFAFAYEGMARAHALSGQHDRARKFLAQAEAAGQAIADDEDRAYFFSDLRGGEWSGLSPESTPA